MERLFPWPSGSEDVRKSLAVMCQATWRRKPAGRDHAEERRKMSETKRLVLVFLSHTHVFLSYTSQ